jgi:hypothetical protein
MQKTYWSISSATSLAPPNAPNFAGKLEVKLPVFFTNSMNKDKFIEVRYCKAIYKDALVNDIKFHSTIVKEFSFDDHFVCFTNETLVKPKKYRWNSSDKTIQIWFTDIRNQDIDLIDFHIDILLMY